MYIIFTGHVLELKDDNRTKICSYCGKRVSKEELPITHLGKRAIQYTCFCSDWANNTEDKFEEELFKFKRNNTLFYKIAQMKKQQVIETISEPTKNKKKSASTRVEHIESGKCFPSVYACAKYYNVSATKVRNNKDNEFRFLK